MVLESKKHEETLALNELTPSPESPTIFVLSDLHNHLHNRRGFGSETQRGQGTSLPKAPELGCKGAGIRTCVF